MRTVKEKDLEKIMYWRMLPEVTRFMYSDPVLTVNKQKEWFNTIQERHDCKYWIIVVNGCEAGVLNLSNIDNTNNSCSWGWYIGESSCKGLGIAPRIEINVYQYVFDILNLNRLHSEVFAFNRKVIKLHEKCGSIVEGLLKEYIRKNEQYYDVVVMGITASRWNQVKMSMPYFREIIFED